LPAARPVPTKLLSIDGINFLSFTMGPNYGVLGATFKVTRALQVACMVAVIGMTANFISEVVSQNATPPPVLIGTLSVVRVSMPDPCTRN